MFYQVFPLYVNFLSNFLKTTGNKYLEGSCNMELRKQSEAQYGVYDLYKHDII